MQSSVGEGQGQRRGNGAGGEGSALAKVTEFGKACE